MQCNENKILKHSIFEENQMKQKLSVSLEETLLKSIDKLVGTGKFRNKSHVVEFSVNKIIKENLGEGNE